MSGILGLWNLDGAPVDESVLGRMSAALAHRGPDGDGRRVVGSVGFAHRHLWVTPEEVGERQPLTVRAGLTLVLDGRLDNRNELLARLELPRSASDAACVLAAYDVWGESLADKLIGDFAFAIHDEQRHRLLLARDSIGIRPLYFFRSARLFVFASEIKALLAHPDVPARPDDDGLADFLMLGSRPLDRPDVTCFAGISALAPAHAATVTLERTTTRRYWDFDVGRAVRLSSFSEYVEAFRERFAEAVRRRARGANPIAVSVSGGLDSSSILCQAETLRRSGSAPTPGVIGISYTAAEGSEADEQRYLRDIEREYGMPIRRIPIEPLRGVVRGAEEQIQAIEAPFLDYMWGATRAVHHAARERGARVLLMGVWGDQVLFSSAYLVDLFRRFRWGTIRRHTQEYARWFGTEGARALKRRFVLEVVRRVVPDFLAPPLKALRRRIFPPPRVGPWFSEAFLGRALRFANRPVRLGSGFHSAHARSIYLEARSKYHVQCMESNNKAAAFHGLDLAFPFLDRDLIAFLMAAPGEVQARGGIPRVLLREALKGVLPDAIRARTWKADFTGSVNAGVAQDLRAISDALSGNALGVRLGYLDGRRLAGEVARLGARLTGTSAIEAWELTDMFGLEVWLQVFLSRANGERTLAPAVPTMGGTLHVQSEEKPGPEAEGEKTVSEAPAGRPR